MIMFLDSQVISFSAIRGRCIFLSLGPARPPWLETDALSAATDLVPAQGFQVRLIKVDGIGGPGPFLYMGLSANIARRIP